MYQICDHVSGGVFAWCWAHSIPRCVDFKPSLRIKKLSFAAGKIMELPVAPYQSIQWPRSLFSVNFKLEKMVIEQMHIRPTLHYFDLLWICWQQVVQHHDMLGWRGFLKVYLLCKLDWLLTFDLLWTCCTASPPYLPPWCSAGAYAPRTRTICNL